MPRIGIYLDCCILANVKRLASHGLRSPTSCGSGRYGPFRLCGPPQAMLHTQLHPDQLVCEQTVCDPLPAMPRTQLRPGQPAFGWTSCGPLPAMPRMPLRPGRLSHGPLCSVGRPIHISSWHRGLPRPVMTGAANKPPMKSGRR